MPVSLFEFAAEIKELKKSFSFFILIPMYLI